MLHFENVISIACGQKLRYYFPFVSATSFTETIITFVKKLGT